MFRLNLFLAADGCSSYCGKETGVSYGCRHDGDREPIPCQVYMDNSTKMVIISTS
jgi:hypothetical protein